MDLREASTSVLVVQDWNEAVSLLSNEDEDSNDDETRLPMARQSKRTDMIQHQYGLHSKKKAMSSA